MEKEKNNPFFPLESQYFYIYFFMVVETETASYPSSHGLQFDPWVSERQPFFKQVMTEVKEKLKSAKRVALISSYLSSYFPWLLA